MLIGKCIVKGQARYAIYGGVSATEFIKCYAYLPLIFLAVNEIIAAAKNARWTK